MGSIRQVHNYRFPCADWPIARLAIDLSETAAALGIELETWDEDGLGAARGALIGLPSGTVVLIRELAHSRVLFGRYETDVSVDVRELVTLGADRLIEETIASLGATRGAMIWAVNAEGLSHAEDFLTRLDEARLNSGTR